MIKTILALLLINLAIYGQNKFEQDTIKTGSGELVITFIGHGTLMFTYKNLTIHADPFGRLADYNKLPDADIILITHHHGDHLDTAAVSEISNKNTAIILTPTAGQLVKNAKGNLVVMGNGEAKEVRGIKIEAVPAYNLLHKRDNGEPFHPKGVCNGYVVTFGDKKVYVAGDTENIPEMKDIKNIHIAFLPMNLPFTMTPEMAAQAANNIKPKILYPYHFGESNVQELVNLLKDSPEIEVRVRNMK